MENVWRYTLWLVIIRFLLPISIVLLLALTGIDFSNVGIPVLSAILAAAVTGRVVAASAGSMPGWSELLTFAFLATAIFYLVNYAAYYLLAKSGLGPIKMYRFYDWHRSGHIVELMVFLTTVAFISNIAIFPLAIKAELRAMARRNRKVQEQ
ncbi:ABZJ_00895 family protein [Ruegeria atlantica]|uniref:Uncharacterized protein n=1 Tax=Ruegeria atlantica TaxID=81569 RepID=A0A0P1EGW4_9RHOB|nr:ABZJ_00895 family protein [Ruegeria atlantica]CUH49541.1 hypothetical protein RUA4292_03737 [Ruegeria atlantica]